MVRRASIATAVAILTICGCGTPTEISRLDAAATLSTQPQTAISSTATTLGATAVSDTWTDEYRFSVSEKCRTSCSFVIANSGEAEFTHYSHSVHCDDEPA